jgi:hypothetical protein
MEGAMVGDETNARRKRAAQLRRQIENLKGGAKTGKPADGAPEKPDKPAADHAESPRDFIHRRMLELDKKPKK